MENLPSENKANPTIADLYPQLNEEQLKEADENLREYVALALRIYERICSDPEAYAEFKALTRKERHSSILSDPPKPS